jgi:hypothetical protein
MRIINLTTSFSLLCCLRRNFTPFDGNFHLLPKRMENDQDHKEEAVLSKQMKHVNDWRR